MLQKMIRAKVELWATIPIYKKEYNRNPSMAKGGIEPSTGHEEDE